MSAVLILLAAGTGERLGLNKPKAFSLLGGEPMLVHSLASASAALQIDRVVLVAAADMQEEAAAVAGLPEGLQGVDVVPGGDTRQDSVWRGIGAIDTGDDGPAIAVCHDAARPFATPALFDRVVGSVRDRPEISGAIPVLPSPDTVKRVAGGMVLETLPREQVALAQTPQAFDLADLRDAHAKARAAGLRATDDAMLLEAAGYGVAVVDGEPENFKITTQEDLRRAEAYLAAESR